MLINIILFLLATIAFVSASFAIYYHLEFQKACRKGFFIASSYKLELLDQKKSVSIMIATFTFSFTWIIAVLKQNYTGG